MNGEKARIASISSPNSSIRSGLAAGGREDVDDPAANRELAALLDPLHSLVARERQVLGERVDPGLVADGQVEPGRARVQRRHELGERGRRGADDPAGGEHVERACPLAHEVRRRLEPGLPADAAAREERDVFLAEVPGRRLGRVPGVRVLGEQQSKRPAETEVERREEERNAGSETRAPAPRSSSAKAASRSLAASSRASGCSEGAVGRSAGP